MMDYWLTVFGKFIRLFSLSFVGMWLSSLVYLIVLDGPTRPWWLPFAWMFVSGLVTLAVGWNVWLDKKGRFRKKELERADRRAERRRL